MSEEQSEFDRQLRVLKKKHDRIYVATIRQESFIFRALSYKEYEELLMWEDDESVLEEKVCSLAVLFPTRMDWGKAKAGITPFLHKTIIEKSAFMDKSQINNALDAGRQALQSFNEQAIITIVSAFPQYKFEEVEAWDVEKLMKYFTRAEWAHREIFGRKWLEFHKYDEEQKTEEAPTAKQIGQDMREQGLDPMIEFGEPEKPPFVDYPLIGGTSVWENEEVMNLVREQLQRVSGQRELVSKTPSE